MFREESLVTSVMLIVQIAEYVIIQKVFVPALKDLGVRPVKILQTQEDILLIMVLMLILYGLLMAIHQLLSKEIKEGSDQFIIYCLFIF